jgi:hypothetical protein
MNIPKRQPETKPRSREEQIAERLEQMPAIYRKNYLQAVSRKSRAAADKAMCLECMHHAKEEIKACSDLGCPLYRYRPFVRHPKSAGRSKISRKVAKIAGL